jgi:hypothetical protein
MGITMLMNEFLLLPLAAVLGWSGTRISLYIRHSTGSRGDALFLLVLSWSPLVIGLLALLLSLSGSNP